MKRTIIYSMLLLSVPATMSAQQILTLEDCHKMAVSGNNGLEQARQKISMAEYDKKIAAANYFPEISATGAYLFNSKDIALIDDQTSAAIAGMGTAVQQQLGLQMEQLMTAIKSNPATAQEYMKSPMWQTVIGALSQADVSQALNGIGASINEALHPDLKNAYIGSITLKQPIFVGGKIVASNKMAKLAEELSQTQYDSECQNLLLTVDQAYWQIVSIANKKKLAEEYAALLEHMLNDAEISEAEGVLTQSDVLAVKVKYNEAKMMMSRSVNGLALSKMLLCKEIGLPLDSDIVLSDENLETIAQPAMIGAKDMESVFADRPETRSLDLASKIYDQKVKIARADMMPKLALTAGCLVSNPNLYNGFSNDFAGSINVGVMLSVPLFHGTEALQKTRKAKVEAGLYKNRYDDACEMINLQVEQLSRQQTEAYERAVTACSDLDSAEENLRIAMVGFEAGVVSASVTMQAQTAWLQAHSEYIDACVDMQINHSSLLKAQGNYYSDNR